MKKKFLLAFLFLFAFLLFPKDTFAYTWQFFDGQQLCETCDDTTCYPIGYCYNGVDHVRLKDNRYVLQKGITYDLFTSLELDLGMPNSGVCSNNSFGFNGSAYIGNFNGNSWNNQSNITWNSIDDINVGVGGTCRYNWGLVQRVDNTIDSSGISFDFYFNGKKVIYRANVLRFELQNVATTGSDMSSVVNSVNNSANSIVNNSNQNTQNIINNNNANTDKINNTLNDDDTTGASSEASDFFNNFTNNDHGLTGIITSPLRLINAIGSSSCSPLTFPLPFVNKNVTLPCMSTIYQTHFSTFLQVYQIITTGLIAYWVCVKIFQKVKSFKDPSDDKVEVFDL